MCGRFTQLATYAEVHDFLSLKYLRGPVAGELWKQRFNIAPSQAVEVVRMCADGEAAEFAPMKWGLRPGWAKGGKLAPINARAETVRTGPMFRASFKARRGIVAASGFYEWEKLEGGRKQPRYLFPRGAPMFVFGGLWESYDEGEARVDTFAIVTTAASLDVARIHDRMPLILSPASADTWLRGSPDDAAPLMVPAPTGTLDEQAVSDLVNKASAQGPELIAPVG